MRLNNWIQSVLETSFLAGIASSIGFPQALPSPSSPQDDILAIANDWKQVGLDIQNAYEQASTSINN